MSLAFTLLLVIFVVGFLIRMPIGYAMLAGGAAYFLVSGEGLRNASALITNGYYSKFILIAVPMFIFGAQIMNDSTVTNRIFHFAHAVVGRMHGGLAQVNVVNSVIFSGMSGSAIADASGTGTMEIKAMTDAGYPRGFACATTAASATIGPIIPPSIPMVIFAYLSGTSIGMLFAGGIIPGLFLSAMLMVFIRIIAKRRSFERQQWQGMGHLLGAFLRALPAVLTPAILLGGIYTGVFTPTEAAGVAALYAIGLAMLAYRTMGPRKLWEVVGSATSQSAKVALLIGGAFLLNYAIAVEGIPRDAADLLLSITSSSIGLLVIVNVLFLIMGMFLDTTVMLLVMIPIILPTLISSGIDPVHFGVTITLNMMIGLSTPPFGVLLFIVSSVSRTPLREVIREIWPFLAVMLVTLWVLVFVPEIVLFIPELLGYVPRVS